MRLLVGLLLAGAIAGPASEPLTVIIGTDKPRVTAGSPVLINVRLTNTSKQSVILSGGFDADTGLDMANHFDVRDVRGRLIPPRTRRPLPLEMKPLTRGIGPAESFTEQEEH